MSEARVLVVDDEDRMARAVAAALERGGWTCEAVTSGEAALAAFESRGADVVVTDRRMPGMDGLELMRRLRERRPFLPVILLTAHADVSSAVKAMRDGAFDYVAKPFDNDELRALVARALELGRLQRENRLLRRELSTRTEAELVGQSESMRAVVALVDRAAASKASVLIQGESGTGKELLVRRLHLGSERLGQPLVAVNCKAFADTLLESELFGHEKGAFTGAASARAGCFERAHGGTLFLDEIGEVDLGFQAKILRAVQEGEVLRVGGDRPRHVDVRIAAATSRDLAAEIHAGRFREDLYFRLNVIPVQVPPLRERRADVLPLARHFLAQFSSGRSLELTSEAQSALLEHPWPGNVRELQNAIERASVLARSDAIEPADLLLEAPRRRAPGGGSLSGTLQESLDRAAAARVRAALATSGGARAAAAAELGIDRTTLFRLIKRLGL